MLRGARYRRLCATGKKLPIVVAAIAREMAAFLWGYRKGGRARGRRDDGLLSTAAQSRERSTKGGETPVASYVAGLAPDARPLLDRGKPRDEDTEGGNQPADKSLINRRFSLALAPSSAQPKPFFSPTAFAPNGRSTAPCPLTANTRNLHDAPYPRKCTGRR